MPTMRANILLKIIQMSMASITNLGEEYINKRFQHMYQVYEFYKHIKNIALHRIIFNKQVH